MAYNHQNIGFINLLQFRDPILGVIALSPNAWHMSDAGTASVDTSGYNTVAGTNYYSSRLWDFSNNNIHADTAGTTVPGGNTPGWRPFIQNNRAAIFSDKNPGTSGEPQTGSPAYLNYQLSINDTGDFSMFCVSMAVWETSRCDLDIKNYSSQKDNYYMLHRTSSCEFIRKTAGGTYSKYVVTGLTNSTPYLSYYNNSSFKVNGVIAGSGSSTITTNFGNSTIYLTSGSSGRGGHFMEQIIFNKTLTPTEVTTVENYLKQKWNISY